MDNQLLDSVCSFSKTKLFERVSLKAKLHVCLDN